MYTALALGLAALGSVTAQTNTNLPRKSQEFGLAMKVDGTLVSLNAVDNGTVGNKVLEAERLSVYPGTPAYFNSTKGHEYKALNFVIDGFPYGIGVPKVGDNYGYAASAYAIDGYQQFEWLLEGSSNQIQHVPSAALNEFYACKDVAQDHVENYFLKWGTQKINGDPPNGCQRTEVVRNCNIEGGLKC